MDDDQLDRHMEETGGICFQQNAKDQLVEVEGVLEVGKQCSALLVKMESGASLVAHWLGVCLPVQGTRVPALVWEDPTCRGATGPMSHNY